MFEEPRQYVLGKIFTGNTMALRSSKGIVVVEEKSISCNIYTVFLPLEPAVGLELLTKLKVTLDGPKMRVGVKGGSVRR